MSQETNENYDIYENYLTRGATKSVADIGAGLDNDVTNLSTDGISKELHAVETELLQSFLSLTVVSNNIEDTMIIVDKNGIETTESMARRTEVLERLRTILSDNKSLKTRVLMACPDLETDLKTALGDDYSTYTSGTSRLLKLCGTVNSVHVRKDKSKYYDDEPASIVGPKKPFYYDEDEEPEYVPVKQIDEDEIESDKDMLDFISGMLDHPSFIRATLVEKRFVRDKIKEFKDKSSARGVELESSIVTSVEEASHDTLESLGDLEKYSRHIKAQPREREL